MFMVTGFGKQFLAKYLQETSHTLLRNAVHRQRRMERLSNTEMALCICCELCTCRYHRRAFIMAYGSTPYVGMVPKKNGGHIKSAQMTRSKCLH